MGPSPGLGKVPGGGEGPSKVRGGGGRGGVSVGSFSDGVLGQLRETLPLGRGSVLLPGPAKVADFTAKLGEAGQDRTEGRGTGRTRLDGDQR